MIGFQWLKIKLSTKLLNTANIV